MELLKPSPHRLSDRRLARLLMRRLYSIYDAGGISGRLWRSVALEFVMGIIPLDLPEDFHEREVSTEALIKSAHRRKPPSARIRDEFFLGLSAVTHECYISLVLERIGRYYAQDPLTELPGGWYISLEEKAIFMAFFRLFPVEGYAGWFKQHAPEPTDRELIEEGRLRARAIHAADARL